MASANSTDILPPFPIVPGVSIRHIPNALGYAASDDGRIWSCIQRGSRSGPNARKSEFSGNWRERRQVPAGNRKFRYPYVSVPRNGKKVNVKVCVLILETFVGPRPPGMYACHSPDRNTFNSKLSNLRWDTPTANCADMIEHGTARLGEAMWSSKLTEANVIEIRAAKKAGATANELAAMFGVSPGMIRNIIARRNWTHV